MRRKYLYKKPYRIKKKKSIFRNRFFWIAILILIIFGGIFYLVCFSSVFQVKDVKISGNQKIQTQDIENLIKEKINKKLLFFPQKSIFLIDSNEIVRSLSEKFLKIDKVILKRRLPATLIVEIQERLPLGVWCQGENCFYVDREGIIFEENPPKVEEDKSFSPPFAATRETEFIIKSQEQRTEIFLGEKVIEKVLLESIFEIQRKLKENLKIDIEEIIILEKEKINAKTSEGWEIYFDPTGDINWQLTKLSLVLEKEIPPERRKDLEYIDLRFGNFAPYKYRD